MEREPGLKDPGAGKVNMAKTVDTHRNPSKIQHWTLSN